MVSIWTVQKYIRWFECVEWAPRGRGYTHLSPKNFSCMVSLSLKYKGPIGWFTPTIPLCLFVVPT